MTASIWFLGITGEEQAEGSEQPSIDEVIHRSWDTDQLTTNLGSDHIIRASFRIETDDPDTRMNVEMRDFQIKNLIIHRLAEQSADELRSSEGLRELEETLRTDINELLESGTVVEVYTTERVIQ